MGLKMRKKLQTKILLKNYLNVNFSRKYKLYVPRGLSWIVALDDVEIFLKNSGLPYIKVGDEYVEAFAGIFNPEPIFYAIHNNTLLISDDVFMLMNYVRKRKIDTQALMEFLEFKNALGGKLVFMGIQLLQGGERLIYMDGDVRINTQFLYFSEERLQDKELAEELFLELVKEVFRDYFKALSNKLIVIPLSSGYDSRFLVSVAYMTKAKNLLTITYGVGDKRNFELPVAKAVANKLGIPHIFIEYRLEDFQEIEQNLMSILLRYSQLFRTFNMLELIAVRKFSQIIRESPELGSSVKPEDIVFMPGDTGDFLSGGHITLDMIFSYNISDLARAILNLHSIFKEPYPRQIIKLLEEYLLESVSTIRHVYGKDSKPTLVDLAEIFDWRERQYKFIASARLPYLDYGFGYAIPLWDKRLVKFFLSLDLKLKWKQKFYKRILRKHFFKPLGIDYSNKSLNKLIIQSVIEPIVDKVVKMPIKTSFHLNLYRAITKKKVGGFPPNPCGFDTFFPYLYSRISRVRFPRSRKLRDVHGLISLLTVQSIIDYSRE